MPLESLPYVDEQSTDVAATAERTWEALIGYVAAARGNRRGRVLAKRLGCVPGEASGDAGEIGSTIPGFIVSRSVAPAVLALVGEHRFARYALIFRIDETAAGPVRLRAETPGRVPRSPRARLPGAGDRHQRPRARRALDAALDSQRRRAGLSARGLKDPPIGNTILIAIRTSQQLGRVAADIGSEGGTLSTRRP